MYKTNKRPKHNMSYFLKHLIKFSVHLCMLLCTRVHAADTCVEIRTIRRSQFSPSTMSAPRISFRSSFGSKRL